MKIDGFFRQTRDFLKVQFHKGVRLNKGSEKHLGAVEEIKTAAYSGKTVY